MFWKEHASRKVGAKTKPNERLCNAKESACTGAGLVWFHIPWLKIGQNICLRLLCTTTHQTLQRFFRTLVEVTTWSYGHLCQLLPLPAKKGWVALWTISWLLRQRSKLLPSCWHPTPGGFGVPRDPYSNEIPTPPMSSGWCSWPGQLNGLGPASTGGTGQDGQPAPRHLGMRMPLTGRGPKNFLLLTSIINVCFSSGLICLKKSYSANV